MIAKIYRFMSFFYIWIYFYYSWLLNQTGGVRIAAVGCRTLAVIRDSQTETRILLVNAGDTPTRAVLYPALFCEGPDATKPLAFAGAYRAEDGMRIEAHASLSVTVPGTGFKLLKKA